MKRAKPPLFAKLVLFVAAVAAGWNIAQEDTNTLGVVFAIVAPACWFVVDYFVTIGWHERLEREANENS